MIKIIKYIFLMIALGCATWLQAKPVIKATFNQNNTCPNLVAVAVILEHSSTGDKNFKIGSSSLLLNYDTDKLSFYEYVEINFEEHCYDVSETANSQNGFINISIEDVTANLQFSSSNTAHLVGYIYFNMAAGENLSEGDVYYNEYFTSFNNKMSNDGSDQLTVEFDNSLTVNNETITCPSNNCNENDPVLVNNVTRDWMPVCTVGDGSLSLNWPNDSYYNDLQISTNGGDTFETTATGQTNYTRTDLAVGDYDIKLKIGENGCITTLDDINIIDLSHEVTVNYQQPTCGGSDGSIELAWISKSVMDMQISLDRGVTYTTISGDDEYHKFDNLPEGDYDIQVKWSYWKFACPANVEVVTLVENCCTGNDPILVNNITRSGIPVCTVDDGSLSLNWPNDSYYNDLQISINGGQTFETTTAGQTNFSVANLAVGDYDIKVKIGSGGCVTTLDDINIIDLSHEVTRTWGNATCGQSDGWLALTWISKSTLDIEISIDGGETYVTKPGADEYYRVDGLAVGDYDIWVKWDYAPFACPTQLDDINLGIKNPTNTGLRANYYCANNRLRFREVNIDAEVYKYQYRRLTNGAWTGWINTANDADGIVNIYNLPANTTAVKYRVLVKCNGKWSGWGQQKHYNFPSCRLGNTELAESFSLYPNPANDYVNIQLKNIDFTEGVIKIYSLTGKLIMEKSLVPDERLVSIDARELISGIYLVKIITNGGDKIYSNKLTIAH